ncbi:MAG: hypothetical protein NZ805_07560 [Armatimonadetes bacterium]|nr:hypothetical protein [Armatimonadota bacterium]MDW8029281.1 hypothetical protein [Armatimonadota bacterium]
MSHSLAKFVIPKNWRYFRPNWLLTAETVALIIRTPRYVEVSSN